MANGTALQALAITGISYLLFFASALPAVPATRTVVLFDRSASMLQPHQGSRKIDLAKQLFANMSSQFTQDPNLSVRFFAGGTSADPTLDCSASKIGLAPAPNRGASEFTALLDQVNAVGHQTPITYALGLAQADMATWSGPRKIILISDGQRH